MLINESAHNLPACVVPVCVCRRYGVLAGHREHAAAPQTLCGAAAAAVTSITARGENLWVAVYHISSANRCTHRCVGLLRA
jgi:hypothetical protein